MTKENICEIILKEKARISFSFGKRILSRELDESQLVFGDAAVSQDRISNVISLIVVTWLQYEAVRSSSVSQMTPDLLCGWRGVIIRSAAYFCFFFLHDFITLHTLRHDTLH